MYLQSFLLPPITVHCIRLPLLLKHCIRIMFPHFLCYFLLWAVAFCYGALADASFLRDLYRGVARRPTPVSREVRVFGRHAKGFLSPIQRTSVGKWMSNRSEVAALRDELWRPKRKALRRQCSRGYVEITYARPSNNALRSCMVLQWRCVLFLNLNLFIFSFETLFVLGCEDPWQPVQTHEHNSAAWELSQR